MNNNNKNTKSTASTENYTRPAVEGPVVALAGGVGAARLLRGLVATVPPAQVVAIVNTGDDREFYGVHVSPDLDIVSYSLAGVVDPEKGYGLENDTFQLVDTLDALGHESWFRLGDRDYARCLHRTLRLREGAGLAQISDELRRDLGLATRLLPMSDDPCPTLVELSDGRCLHFEEYLIREGSPDDVKRVDLAAARAARPAPGVLEAIEQARTIVICPSNPVVSIGPILAVPGIREALVRAAAPVVAISPIVGGAPIKGPADRLLRGIGREVSALGVAEMYRGLADAFVLDAVDAALTPEIEGLGMRARAIDTLMKSPAIAAEVARTALTLAAEAAAGEPR
ncbi:MAG: 2-phospho-L-lactate transferase [Deltaproteobacteria bacterium]|nr:2-phospho-L-lactate transferase [Deltaproteobacteria bacterium]MBW2417830.1 2-phospho-L-lactate transferase [Deltaproteobacteria bacterium]